MKLARTVIFILGLLTAVSKMAFAQSSDEAVELENVVITATRTPVPLAQTASSVTVIDSTTMEEKHVRTVLEALRDVPGMDIVQQGGMGGVTSAFLRGTNSNQTLVLIDGV
ncbi:MAG: TonB-dependent receptor plug domain-containing protein, partial [Nitrospiria bacterium]